MATPPIEKRAQALSDLGLTPIAQKRRVLVIVNPYATTVSERLKNLVIYALQSRYEVEAIDTQQRDHATEICKNAVADGQHELVISFGGDGTANEVAMGLLGTGVPMACLPGGLTNVFGRMIGMPADVIDATEHLLLLADRFKPKAVDVGEANGRVFLFSAGVGLDAAVVKAVDQRPALKSRFGEWFYVSAAIGTFARRYMFDAPRFTATSDGQKAHGVTAIAQNGHIFTFFGEREVQLCEAAALDTGKISVIALDRANPLDLPTLAWRLLSPRAKVTKHRHVAHFENVDSVTITALGAKPLPLQVDGDYIGEHAEVVFRARPGALSVVV